MQQTEPTVAALPESDQDRLAQILDDYLVAAERGTPIAPDELLRQYPQDAEYLRAYLSGLQLFHNAAVDAAKAPPTALVGGTSTAAETIGDFRLLREIGRGGMGVVYEAMQISLRRRVALKILPFAAGHDARQIGRFRTEAQAAAQMQHPNIVRCMRYFEENGLLGNWRQHTGHAIGLRNHEAPFLDLGDHTTIEPGMVFTIEPGTYDPEIGGFRHSDTVVVTPDGIDVLTAYPSDIESLTIPP